MTITHARRRRGFTLLELVLALTLTAIVGTVAGSALVTSRQAANRIATHREHEGRVVQWSETLRDLLRHAPPASQTALPLLTTAQHPHGAVLQFLSRGLTPPFGTGAVWLVTVSADSGMLRMRAVPASEVAMSNESGPTDPLASVATVLEWEVPDVQQLAVQVAAPDANGTLVWRADWPLMRSRPALVALTWQQTDGTSRQLVAHLAPLGAAAP